MVGLAVFQRWKIVALQKVQDLDHLGPAARQGVRQHLVPAVRAPHRVVDVGRVGFEVGQRDEPSVPFEVRRDPLGDLAPVDDVGAALGDEFERAGVVPLHEQFSGSPRNAVVEEDARGGFGRLDLGEERNHTRGRLRPGREAARQGAGDLEAVVCEPNRRLDEFGPRPGPEPAPRLPQAGDRAGGDDGPVTDLVDVAAHLPAIRVSVDPPFERAPVDVGRGFAAGPPVEIDGDGASTARVVHHHAAESADSRRERGRDELREGRGDRRVDRVAAAPQGADPGLHGDRSARDDDAAFGPWRPRARGECGGLLTPRTARTERTRGDSTHPGRRRPDEGPSRPSVCRSEVSPVSLHVTTPFLESGTGRSSSRLMENVAPVGLPVSDRSTQNVVSTAERSAIPCRIRATVCATVPRHRLPQSCVFRDPRAVEPAGLPVSVSSAQLRVPTWMPSPEHPGPPSDLSQCDPSQAELIAF